MTPCIIWRQTIPHHSVFHNHISHLASQHITDSTSQTHFTPRLTLHDITFSISPYRTYSASYLIPHHSHIRMNKAQHPTSGIAKHSTSHQIPHHTIPHHAMWCVIWWNWNMWNDVRCGMVCCAGNVPVWCEILLRCGIYNPLLLHLAHHSTIFTLHHSTSNTISDIIPNHPRHTIIPHGITHFISHQHLSQHTIPLCNTILFHITPAPLAAHYSTLQYHISNRTVSATLCITQHLALHPISHQVTFHITPHSMFPPHFISHHILDTLCVAPPHLASHHILHIAGTAFYMHHSTTSDRDHTQFHIPLPCFT